MSEVWFRTGRRRVLGVHVSEKVMLEATLTIRYEATPEHYEGAGETSPADMALVDEQAMLDDPGILINLVDIVSTYDLRVRVAD